MNLTTVFVKEVMSSTVVSLKCFILKVFLVLSNVVITLFLGKINVLVLKPKMFNMDTNLR